MEADLDLCLQKAQDEFNATFALNSVSAPQENYPDARTWNN
jgi:hypothetical protein